METATEHKSHEEFHLQALIMSDFDAKGFVTHLYIDWLTSTGSRTLNSGSITNFSFTYYFSSALAKDMLQSLNLEFWGSLSVYV